MKKLLSLTICFVLITLFISCEVSYADNTKSIKLSAPQTKGGMPLMEALNNRKTMRELSPENADFYAATDTGFISENVYLFCASTGLVTVVRGNIDKPALAKAMKLRPDQKVILTQTVGYPAGYAGK